MKRNFVAALVLAIVGTAAGAVGTTVDTKLGTVIANNDGMTLYTFDKDVDGVPACYDACAKNWPPFMAKADAVAEGDFGLVARKDGAMQWTYKGEPLYLWVNDHTSGDVTGDGIGGTWHAAVQ